MKEKSTRTSPKPDLNKTLTIYGRNAVLEALQDNSLHIRALHLADSNKPAKVLDQIEALSRSRNIPVEYRDRLSLSRISKNKKQDQGVALDIILPNMQSLDDALGTLFNDEASNLAANPQLIALENVTNPQNLGMIIRSVAASGIEGLIIPEKGCSDIGPLTIKASAGAVFSCPIIRCHTVSGALEKLRDRFSICALELGGEKGFAELERDKPRVFVLGNESTGLSSPLLQSADERMCITMANGVESLNVAVTASLVAFKVRPL